MHDFMKFFNSKSKDYPIELKEWLLEHEGGY